MTIYRKSPTKQLKRGDTLIFSVRGVEYEYSVQTDHLNYNRGSNDKIFEVLCVEDPDKFCSAAYGHEAKNYTFPEPRYEDYAALTRVARALYARIERPNKKVRAEMAAYHRRQTKVVKAEQLAERKQEAAYAKTLRGLSARGRRVAKLLHSDSAMFGCQREDVVALVSALLGENLTRAVES